MTLIKKAGIYVILLSVSLALSSCYSFTGASVPPHLNSIYIPFFEDRSGSGFPNFSQDFTNTLVRMFREDNTLQIAESKQGADALLECTIVSVREELQAVTDNQGGLQQKSLRVSVKARYRDLVKKKQIFDKNFSSDVTFSATGNTVQNRQEAIERVIELVSEDIMLGVVSDW